MERNHATRREGISHHACPFYRQYSKSWLKFLCLPFGLRIGQNLTKIGDDMAQQRGENRKFYGWAKLSVTNARFLKTNAKFAPHHDPKTNGMRILFFHLPPKRIKKNDSGKGTPFNWQVYGGSPPMRPINRL